MWNLSGDSMLKCMVCGRQLHYISNSHLKGHGLTIQQYKTRFSAEVFSQEVLQKIRESCRKYASQRTFQRTCPRCGSAFTTGGSKTFYCRRCQPVVSLEKRIEKRRRYQRRYRRMRKRTMGRDQLLGTFNKRYLSIHNGHVLGAVLLERGVCLNGGRAYNGGQKPLNCDDCGSNMVISIIDHEARCSECGGKIVVARKNEHYSIQAEPVCDSCGLVYVVPQIPFFLFWGDLTVNKIAVDCAFSSLGGSPIGGLSGFGGLAGMNLSLYLW